MQTKGWSVGLLVLGLAASVAGAQMLPPGRASHSTAFDSIRGRTVIFGGASWVAGFGDTWEWSGTSWQQMQPANSPSARRHCAMAFDAARGVCVLFGGLSTSWPGHAETWEWDGVNWTLRSLPSSPPPRGYPAMAYDPTRQRTVMYGGFDGSGNYDDTWEYDGSTWTQINTPNAPSARGAHDLVFDPVRGEVVLFGGAFQTSIYNDTWVYTGSGWQQRFPTTSPSPRGSHGLAFSPQSGKVVMFGGTTHMNNGPGLSDTWEWDGVNWSQVASPSSPVGRWFLSDTMDVDATGNVFLFGGYIYATAFGDAWRFGANGWRHAIAYASSPVNGRRYGLTPPMTWQQAEALAVQEGGHLATIRNAQEQSWAWQTFSGQNAWIGLNDRAVEGSWVWASGEPVSYLSWNIGTDPNGGTGENAVGLWNDYGGNWADANEASLQRGLIELPGGPTAPLTATTLPTSATPVPLTAHAVAPLPTSGALLFGGTTTTLPQPFTFTLTNTAWAKEFSLLNPMARADHTLLLDPARANNLLFGGRNALGAALNDTWTFAGGQWTYLQLATAPSPRSGHRMAFDPTTNTGLLFGGVDAQNQPLGDFWSWNGTAWTQLAPATLPPARGHHGLAWDARRSRLVLFGGQAGATRLQDTWEWDGTAWTQWTPTPPPAPLPLWAPSARRGHGMAYDPRSERVVVVGGESANGCEGDVWSWDGAGWTRHVTAGPLPSARTGLQLYHDAGANELRLFGGGCGTSYTNDLWSLQLPVYARSTTYGAGCAGSLATPGLALLPPSAPIVGTTMNLEITGVPGSFIPALGALGYSRTSWLGLPLPLDLAPAGLPGCPLLQSAEVVSAVAPPNGTGVVTWPVAIPNNPLLLGGEVFFQALAIEVPGFPRWASLSNGLAVRLGDR